MNIKEATISELASMIGGAKVGNDIFIGSQRIPTEEVRRLLYQRNTNPISMVSGRGGMTNQIAEQSFIQREIKKKRRI